MVPAAWQRCLHLCHCAHILSMTWDVEYTDEFEAWWLGLDVDEQESVAASIGLIEALGPPVPFPHSSGVESSRHGRMRELRVQHRGAPSRILYAFDPRRTLQGWR